MLTPKNLARWVLPRGGRVEDMVVGDKGVSEVCEERDFSGDLQAGAFNVL
jgi:hypothetical protein